MENRWDYRSKWFKILACSSHTLPVLACEDCWNKISDKLAVICNQDYEKI